MLIEAGCKPTFATMNSDFKVILCVFLILVTSIIINYVVQESALTLAAYKGHVEIVNYLIHLDCNKGRVRALTNFVGHNLF